MVICVLKWTRVIILTDPVQLDTGPKPHPFQTHYCHVCILYINYIIKFVLCTFSLYLIFVNCIRFSPYLNIVLIVYIVLIMFDLHGKLN